MLLPWLLIIFGIIFLLENLNIIPNIEWSILWPIILILAGFFMLKKKSGHNCCGWMKKKEEEKK